MTKPFLKLTSLVMLALLVSAARTSAQDWRGISRAAGKVMDADSGKPIDGATIKAMLPSSDNRGPESKSNAKGEWAIGGVASGVWAIDFMKEGYETRSISLPISGGGGGRPIEIRLKKKAAAVADPNVEIKERLTAAAALMRNKQYAEARAIYEELVAKHPDVKQFRPLIARTHYGEGNKALAIEHLRRALAQDPANVEVQLLLGSTLMEDGKADEARQVLAAVDESKVTDPTVYLNIGIALINDRKQADAVTWFDKAIARFPTQSDAYYYRGISNLSLGKTTEAKADLEKFVSIAPTDAPELPTAKKILESIK